jgi:polyhydroxyalkanoate synthesis repressor PhaR
MTDQKPKIVIRKYENRRLYDSAHSRYVNLDEVARLIRDGNDVQVVDAKTGEDLTRSILTQVIVEESRGSESGLPLELLKQIILSTEEARHQFLEWYLKSAIDTFDRMQKQLREYQAAPAVNPLESMMSLFRGVPSSMPLMPWLPFQQPAGPAAPAGAGSAAPQQPSLPWPFPQWPTPAFESPTVSEQPSSPAAPEFAPGQPGVDVAEMLRRLEDLERQVAAEKQTEKKKAPRRHKG